MSVKQATYGLGQSASLMMSVSKLRPFVRNWLSRFTAKPSVYLPKMPRGVVSKAPEITADVMASRRPMIT